MGFTKERLSESSVHFKTTGLYKRVGFVMIEIGQEIKSEGI